MELQSFKCPIHTLNVSGFYVFVFAPINSSEVLQKLDGSALFCLGWKGLNSEAYERYWLKRECEIMKLLDVILISDWHAVSFEDNCCKDIVVETKWASRMLSIFSLLVGWAGNLDRLLLAKY